MVDYGCGRSARLFRPLRVEIVSMALMYVVV